MTREAKKRLFDARQACEALAQFVAGRTLSDYSSDLLLRSAIERQLTIVGEALSQFARTEPAAAEHIPDLRKIIGLRNRLIHGYSDVDELTVWDILHQDVPALRQTLDTLLAGD